MNIKELINQRNITKRLFYKFLYYYNTLVKRYKDISIKRKNVNMFYMENKRKIFWPGNKIAAFNLQIDDFSTLNKKDGCKYDYGGDIFSRLNLNFEKLVRAYPFLKITLFMIPDPLFKYEGKFIDHWKKNDFLITRRKFRKWRDWINKFTSQVEIANHGLHHWQSEVFGLLHNREFEFKSKKQCKNVLIQSQKIFKKAGFNPVGFKPSGWGVGFNKNFALIDALRELNYFKYVVLSTPLSGLNWDKKRVSNIYPFFYKGLLNIPQNINMLEPLNLILKKIEHIIKYNGIISLQLHFNEEDYWMKDGIGNRMLYKLNVIINFLNKKYNNKIYFATLKEITEWLKLKSQV